MDHELELDGRLQAAWSAPLMEGRPHAGWPCSLTAQHALRHGPSAPPSLDGGQAWWRTSRKHSATKVTPLPTVRVDDRQRPDGGGELERLRRLEPRLGRARGPRLRQLQQHSRTPRHSEAQSRSPGHVYLFAVDAATPRPIALGRLEGLDALSAHRTWKIQASEQSQARVPHRRRMRTTTALVAQIYDKRRNIRRPRA